MNLRTLDLNLLVAFEALIIEKSVTRAAARVGITQPAMSNTLSRLRHVFEDPLLVRTGRSMALTPRAAELSVAVQEALTVLRRALATGRPPEESAPRTFVVGMTEYMERLLLPELCRRIANSPHEIQVVSRRLPSLFETPEDELQAGLLDAAASFLPTSGLPRPGIRMEAFLQDQHVCVARRNHPEVRRELSLKQFAALGHISIFYRNEGTSIIDERLKAHGLKRRITAQVAHLSSALALVASTDLICTIPMRFVLKSESLPSLKMIQPPLPVAKLIGGLCWHNRSESDHGAAWLRAEMKSIGNLQKER